MIPQVRKEAIQRAFDFAGDAWKEAYRDFILAYAETHSEFIAEDISLSYQKDSSNPMPNKDFRASGGIFLKLVREGKLKRIGYGQSRLRGVPVPKFTKG